MKVRARWTVFYIVYILCLSRDEGAGALVAVNVAGVDVFAAFAAPGQRLQLHQAVVVYKQQFLFLF
jgi:hypothetical protein